MNSESNGLSMPGNLLRVTDSLWVYQGHINVGIIRKGNSAVLIDFGDGSVMGALADTGIETVDAALFTHYHRDQCCGVPALSGGTKIVVPEAERRWFEDVPSYWNDSQYRYRLYESLRPHHLMLSESVRVDQVMSKGSRLTIGECVISAIETPGHTDGSLTYIVETEGRRIAFTGDLIYDEGQIWELYSLQQGVHGTDYHGFLDGRHRLLESLEKVVHEGPDALVPSHGNIMWDPRQAVDLLRERLGECYRKYAQVSALRYYFPDMFGDLADDPGAMPVRQGVAAPDFLTHTGTSWILRSESGAAFVMDCVDESSASAIIEMAERGEITTVEGVWITHTHYDHTDGIPALARHFGCPVYADRSVAEVLTRPRDWNLPCLSDEPLDIAHSTDSGESWKWHEFTMTAYHLPGQSLYHGGLLVEGRGLGMLFAGDSFTPAGIDDYCAQNRNFLGEDVGFDRCVKLVQALAPDLIFNAHLSEAFTLNDWECNYVRENLRDRQALFGRLLPWDSPNYGMDEWWAVCRPYEYTVKPGECVELIVVITNHFCTPTTATARAVLPKHWDSEGTAVSATIDAGSEGRLILKSTVPGFVASGRYVIPLDITWDNLYLPQFAEAIIIVS